VQVQTINLTKTYPGNVTAIHPMNIQLTDGVIGLLGPNGAGKTSLVDAVTGLVRVAEGEVWLDGHRVDGLPPHVRARLGMARTFQGVELFDDLSVDENLAVALEACPDRARPGHQWPYLAGVEAVGEEAPSGLPHGSRARVALARALAADPTLLVLDEPAAGLDTRDRRDLAATLRGLADDGMGILVVEHDVGLVFDLCDEVCVLDFGRLIARGPAPEVRADPEVRAAYLGRPLEARSPAAMPAPITHTQGPSGPPERGAYVGPSRPRPWASSTHQRHRVAMAEASPE
jgi:branched-chain amino acid transport system ATP-binding protein